MKQTTKTHLAPEAAVEPAAAPEAAGAGVGVAAAGGGVGKLSGIPDIRNCSKAKKVCGVS